MLSAVAYQLSAAKVAALDFAKKNDGGNIICTFY